MTPISSRAQRPAENLSPSSSENSIISSQPPNIRPNQTQTRFETRAPRLLPSAPTPTRHALFNDDLVRQLRGLWSEGSEGDPPPSAPMPPPFWEGALPSIREEGGILIDGIRELFVETETVENPAPPPDLTPSVDEVLRMHIFFEKVSGEAQDDLWRRTIAELRAEGYPHLPPEDETYRSFRARLDALGPHAADRICSLRHALTLLHNHDTLGSRTVDQPVAVVIGPTADYNGAFNATPGFPVLDALIESGRFHVLYFETSNEDGAREALATAREGTGRRIHTGVFGGHGMPTALAFGGADPLRAIMETPEEEFLQVEDLVSGDLGDLNDLFEPDGQILLWSCSNGAGGENAFNMANGMAEHVPGRRIYSTPVPSNLSHLVVREDLSLDLGWRETEGYIATFEEGDRSMFLPVTSKPQNRPGHAERNTQLISG